MTEKKQFCGYVTPLVGDEVGTKVGITNGSWTKFIQNLKDFESDIILLSNYGYLAIDMDVYNSVFCTEDGNLYMIDPGRYHPQSSFTSQDYIDNNKLMLDKYFINMLQEEIKYFKLVPDDKVHQLVSLLEEEKRDREYSEYFEEISKKEESIHEFLRIKGLHLR